MRDFSIWKRLAFRVTPIPNGSPISLGLPPRSIQVFGIFAALIGQDENGEAQDVVSEKGAADVSKESEVIFRPEEYFSKMVQNGCSRYFLTWVFYIQCEQR